MEDTEIRKLVARLARRHPSGGRVVERAAILASGDQAEAILEWVVANGGRPEALAPRSVAGGLHGTGSRERGEADVRKALRFVLPPGALDDPA